MVNHKTIILEALGKQGCDSVMDFLQRHPTLPYKELAILLLGEGDWESALILELLHKEQARKAGLFRLACKDALIRFLHDKNVSWKRTTKAIEARVGVFSSWADFMKSPGPPSTVAKEMWDYLEYRVPPQYDWLPQSSDDPIIDELFDKFWPEDNALPRNPKK